MNVSSTAIEKTSVETLEVQKIKNSNEKFQVVVPNGAELIELDDMDIIRKTDHIVAR
jgi:hypothetical protein